MTAIPHHYIIDTIAVCKSYIKFNIQVHEQSQNYKLFNFQTFVQCKSTLMLIHTKYNILKNSVKGIKQNRITTITMILIDHS